MVESIHKETVLVTGITGYCGSWVAKELLEQGRDRFKVRAIVRDPNNLSKLDPIKEDYGELFFNSIEFVKADLTSHESLLKATEGVSYVQHVASPLPGAHTPSAEEMQKAAKDGMQSLIDACVANKVKRIIVTSAFFCMIGNCYKKDKGDHHYTEEDFAPFETANPYAQSKMA